MQNEEKFIRFVTVRENMVASVPAEKQFICTKLLLFANSAVDNRDKYIWKKIH